VSWGRVLLFLVGVTRRRKMAYVKVTIISPDGKVYEAEVDENADKETLLDDLIAELPLETTDKDTPIDYNLNLIGDVKIREGATIQIYRAERSVVRGIKPKP
jgi:hypothetical protein